MSDDPRYQLDVLERLGDPVPELLPAAAPPSGDGPGRSPQALLGKYTKLRKIAQRDAGVSVSFDRGDSSRWEFFLACEAWRHPAANVTRDEVIALVAHARGLHPDAKGKDERASYLGPTVDKAYASVEREKALKAGPESDDAAAVFWWASQRWEATDDPVVSGRAVGRDEAAIIYVTRASGVEKRLCRLGDLYDRDRHVRRVSIVLQCECPRFEPDAAYLIAQKIGRTLGVSDRDEADEFQQMLYDFEAELGHEIYGEPSDWKTLKEAVDWHSVFGATPARAACGIRDGDGRLWLPAGALGAATGRTGEELASDMEDLGYEVRRVDKHAPVGERPEGATEKQGRHIVRVFYAAPCAEPPMPPMPDTRAPVALNTERESRDVEDGVAPARHGGHGGQPFGASVRRAMGGRA